MTTEQLCQTNTGVLQPGYVHWDKSINLLLKSLKPIWVQFCCYLQVNRSCHITWYQSFYISPFPIT